VRLKDNSVSLQGLSSQMAWAMNVTNDLLREEFNVEMVITSANDAHHSRTSLHYTGEAIDFRTRDLSPVELPVMVAKLRSSLFQDFDVVLEDDHCHLEHQPKRRDGPVSLSSNS